MLRTLRFVAVGSLVVGAIACHPKPPIPVLTRSDGTVVERPPEPKPEEEQLARQMADEANKLDSQGQSEAAEGKRNSVLETYPATSAAAEIYENRAQAAEKEGKAEAAVSWYEKLLFYRPSFERINSVRARYAELLLQVGRFRDAANMLRALYGAATVSDERARLGIRFAEAASSAGQAQEALFVLVELQAPNIAAKTREQASKMAFDIVDGALSFKEAEALWSKVAADANWTALQPAIAFKLAKVYYHVRDFKRSEEMLKLVAARFGSSPFASLARDFLARLKSRFEVDTRAVGVILPLSGKYGAYGERSLHAIKLAFASDPSIHLLVKDTQGDPTVASAAVEALVIENHVIAIIGPLFSTEAQAAALKAEELSVPLLSLSHREGLPELGSYVFRTALTISAQAEELARVAFESLGYSRFALLYPRNTYGLEFARAFWDEVDRRKGEIRAAETYEIDQTTFMTPIKKLVGRYYINARSDYHQRVAELRAKKLPSHRFSTELEKITKYLPPVVDFDAIVIPDSGRNIGLIAPALAFEDIITTHDPEKLEKIKKALGNEDVKPVTLLGASTWNSPQTVSSCEHYCEGAVFVDAYYTDNPAPKVRDFISAYREAAGVDPHLSEAQAFDTAGLLRKVLAQKPALRSDLRDKLQSSDVYEGVTGKLRFDEQGEAKKDLFVLTIVDGAIRQWEPPAPPARG